MSKLKLLFRILQKIIDNPVVDELRRAVTGETFSTKMRPLFTTYKDDKFFNQKNRWTMQQGYDDIKTNYESYFIKVGIPNIEDTVRILNKYYYNTLLLTCFFYTINIGISAKLVKDKYHSMSTVSCFFSFSLLVLMKLYNSLVVARQSVKNDKMMSAYMNEFVSYNVIDSDYLEKNKKENQKITNKP